MQRSSETKDQAPPDSFPTARTFELRTLLFVAVSSRVTQSDADNLSLIQRHANLVRETLGQFKGGEEMGRFGESFFILFPSPSTAVRFSLQLQADVRALAEEIHQPVFEKISMDLVEVPAAAPGESQGLANPYEKHAPLCRSLAGLTDGNQILLTPLVFNEARLTLKKDELKPFGSVSWIHHGPCLAPGIETSVEICEIREASDGSVSRPAGLEKAAVDGAQEETTVWGWRPGPGAAVPRTRYVLDEKFADGRWGEEWTGGDPSVKERRLFKFCFRADWVRLLKEQEAVFESVKKKVGHHPNVLAIHGTSLNEPPNYIVTELFEGKDLVSWARERGGVPTIPFPTRLELMAQAAAGLHAAHEARILHRDLLPEHIFVAGSGMTPKEVQAKLTHFGVGHVGLSPRKEEETPVEPPAVAPGETPPPSPEDMYKAPEVIAGQQPNVKSETYSLGVILCQLILGNFSEALTSKRIEEIVGGLKRPGLAGFLASDPQARTAGADRLAGELRAVNKERESRVAGPKRTSRRELILRIAMWSLCVVALAVLGFYGPKYLRRHPRPGPEEDASKKPQGNARADEKKSPDGGKLLADEDRGGKSASEAGEESSDAETTRHRPASAVREKKKEEVKKSAEMLFKLVLLPIALVVIAGTVARQFGPKLKKLFGKNSPSK